MYFFKTVNMTVLFTLGCSQVELVGAVRASLSQNSPVDVAFFTLAGQQVCETQNSKIPCMRNHIKAVHFNDTWKDYW